MFKVDMVFECRTGDYINFALKDLVTGTVKGEGRFGSNWKNVLMDWSNWEFVDMDGSNGQVFTLGSETSLIGNPGQSQFLAFGGDPVG